jgi:hypothetical protein
VEDKKSKKRWGDYPSLKMKKDVFLAFSVMESSKKEKISVIIFFRITTVISNALHVPNATFSFYAE